jgi:glycosyltransferase involved in cell wall biosynthesis
MAAGFSPTTEDGAGLAEGSAVASVVIPAYNSAGRLHVPLAALAAQVAADGSFEVIVVDNASTDATAEVASGHPAVEALRRRGIECRVVREEARGLTHARIRGVLEARGRFVCFLDDDNGPGPRYIAGAVAAFEADRSVGLVVSRVYPCHEAPPPASVARRQHLLAINEDLGEMDLSWGPGGDDLAPTTGAGLWVRRDAFLEAVPWRTPGELLPDRLGPTLSSGGDIELGYLIARAGYRAVYRPGLRVAHVLPASRQRTGYICRLIVGVIRSELTLRAKYLGLRHGPARRLAHLARLVAAALATPVLLLRPDGPREVLFVLADRWARLLGPFPGAFEPGAAVA